MKEHHFTCPNCDEPFEILLPAETTRASFTVCEEIDAKYHNLKHFRDCTNCRQTNTIYYCTIGHLLTFMGGGV